MSVLDYKTIMSRRLSVDNNIYSNLTNKGFIVDTIDKILPQVFESMLDRYSAGMKKFLKDFKFNLYDTFLFMNEWNTKLREYVEQKVSKDIKKVELTEIIDNFISNITNNFKLLNMENVFFSDVYLTSNGVKTFQHEFDIIKNEYFNRDDKTDLKEILHKIYGLMDKYGMRAINEGIKAYDAFAAQYRLLTGDIVTISPLTIVNGSVFFIDDHEIALKLTKGIPLNINEVIGIEEYTKKSSNSNDMPPQLVLLLGPPGIGKSESKYFYLSEIRSQLTEQLNSMEAFLLDNGIDVNKYSIEQLIQERKKWIQSLYTAKVDSVKSIKIINYLDTYIHIYNEIKNIVEKDRIKEKYIDKFCRNTENMYINKDIQSEHPAGKKGLPTVQKIMQNTKDTINVVYPEDLSASNRLSPEYVQFINYDEIDKDYMQLLKSIAVNGGIGGESSKEKVIPTGFYFASGNLGKLDKTPEDNVRINNWALERRFKTFVAIADTDPVLKHFQFLNDLIDAKRGEEEKKFGELYELYGEDKIDQTIMVFLERYGGNSKNNEYGWLNSVPTGGKADGKVSIEALDYFYYKGYITPSTWKYFGKEIYHERKQCVANNIDGENFYARIRDIAQSYLGVDTDIFMEVFRTIDGGLNKVYNFFKQGGEFENIMKSKEILKVVSSMDKKTGQKVEKEFISFEKLNKKINEFLFDKKDKTISENVLEDNIFVNINSFIPILNEYLDSLGNYNTKDNGDDKRKELTKKTIGLLSFMEVLYRKDNEFATGLFSKIEMHIKKHSNFALFKDNMVTPVYNLLKKTEGKDFENINLFNVLYKTHDVGSELELDKFE